MQCNANAYNQNLSASVSRILENHMSRNFMWRTLEINRLQAH